MISKEALEEYKAIYKEEFGEEISDEEALEQAINLPTFTIAIYRPIKKSWLEEFIRNKENEKKAEES